MSLKMTPTNRVILGIVLVIGLGVAFWMLALGPKLDESSKLGTQIEEADASLAAHRAEVAQAVEAREQFPVDYQQLIVLGKAVPGDDDTASLFVQLNKISEGAGVRFQDLQLSSTGGSELTPTESTPAATAPGSQPVSATEVAASTMPLGATIGPAGLAVMPYSLAFEGDFFRIADFIGGLDAMVKTQNEKVAVDGRLITIDGFALSPDPTEPFPALKGTFLVTTYLTPPTQTATGGATPVGLAPTTATPAATTIGGTP
jgi:hypothetical protein